MKILIAEDNHFYRLALKATLTEWGYECVEAHDGLEAWNVLQEPDAPKITIVDWMMPRISGVELCRKVRTLHRPEPTYMIVLTSLDGKESFVEALRAGADDFIHKPFDRDQLHARLQVAKRIVGLQTTQAMVFAFARAVEAKSPYTQGHAERVTGYALALARIIGVPELDQGILRRGALLHDIGKISMPDSILEKPGPLTQDEYEIVKKHPIQGVEIVKPLQTLQDVLPLVRWHHERIDGRGYPDGIQGAEIPFLVRILSVADVYDALSGNRPYRSAMTHQQCLDTMRYDAVNGGLDAELVRIFAEKMKITSGNMAEASTRIGQTTGPNDYSAQLLCKECV